MVDKPVVTKKFDDLVEQLKILPGVGAKTAQRMALNLLTYKRPQGQKLPVCSMATKSATVSTTHNMC